MTTRLSFLLMLLSSTVAQAATAQTMRFAFADKLKACRVPGVDQDVYCGALEVPEDRARPVGRTIRLNIVVLPALTDSVASDAITFLAGGGVVPATRYAAFLNRSLSDVRRKRDILLVDQRGTWNSNALACDAPGEVAPSSVRDDAAALAGLARCRDRLSTRADLRAYTTSAAMDDLDAVRAWLGYDKLTLYGSSYGTKAAQVYLRQYPARVRAAVLRGVVPLDAPMQLDLAASTQESLEQVFSLCAKDAECNATSPDLKARFIGLLTRLAREPVRARPDSSGSLPPIVIDDRVFKNVVQSALNAVATLRTVPALIQAADRGDFRTMLLALVGEPNAPPPPPPAPRGVFLSILCSEEMTKIDTTLIAASAGRTWFGDTQVRQQLGQCRDWPRAALPRDFWTPVRSSTPVLLLSGALDPVTPPRYADKVLQGLPNGRHILLPNRSHGDTDPCSSALIQSFLISADPQRVDTTCLAATAEVHFTSARR